MILFSVLFRLSSKTLRIFTQTFSVYSCATCTSWKKHVYTAAYSDGNRMPGVSEDNFLTMDGQKYDRVQLPPIQPLCASKKA